MKKNIVGLTACVLSLIIGFSLVAFPVSAVIIEAKEAKTVGDVNGDGAVNAIDSYSLCLAVAGKKAADNIAAADANGDGSLDAQDSYLLRTFLSGMRAYLVKDNGTPVGRVIIGKNDLSEFEIVIPSDEELTNDCLEYAAEELQKYIKKALGYTLPIVTEMSGAPFIVYALDSADGSGDLLDEGVDIKVSGGNVYITGGALRGCLYATYEFLERYIGYVFVNDTHEYLYENESIQIDNGNNYSFVPVIKDRGVRTFSTETPTGAVKWKNNSTKCCVNILYSKYGYGIETGSVHTIGDYTYCPNDKYICYTNNAILTEVTEGVLEKIASEKEKGRAIERVSVGPMDNPDCCMCRNCGKIVRAEGSYMGAQLTFINKIADAVAAQYSDVNIFTIAYWYARRPPKTIVPADNVEIMYCWAGCNNHPFDGVKCYEKGNSLWYNNIKESEWYEKWTEICERVWVWIYCGSYSWSFAQPTMLDYMRENAAYLADHGMYGIYCEGEYGYPDAFGDGYSFDLATMYMFSRLNWDPYMTDEEYNAYLDEFLAFYYGKGWENIKSYLQINAEATEAREACWCNNYNLPFDCLDMDYLREHSEEMIELLDSAVSMCETEDELVNTEKLAACVYWQSLAVTYESDFENGTEEQRALYTERYERMYAWMIEHDMTYRVNVPETDEVQDPYSWTDWTTYHQPRSSTDPMAYA